MTARDGQTTSTAGLGQAAFAPTQWALIVAAAGDRRQTLTRKALEALAQAYWFPLYAFVRRQGEGPAQAEDLVQDFFAALIEKEYLAQADRARGKFRSFLLAAMKHFLSKQRDRARAIKRGGGRRLVEMDALEAEARYAVEPADRQTPERLFDRRWAMAVLELVLGRLGREYAAGGKGELYAAIQPSLTGGAEALDTQRAARELKMTPGALRVAVHRLRRRYRDLLKAEIAQTVDSPARVEEEISYLLKCL
ncbi:MAG: sigma-70 family RNA polymerase sigma factor [Planctomycetota bacterium]|nr:sigma-70 family RNA polymerase sigma factor [Planctomycetota bacterium]